MDEYGFIQGFEIDNLIDWNKYQRKYDHELRNTTLQTEAILYFVNEETLAMDHIGRVSVAYREGKLMIEGAYHQEIPINDINNPTLTMRRDFSFFYQQRNYLFKMEHYALIFLRIVQDKY
jgi:hypothetical protein